MGSEALTVVLAAPVILSFLVASVAFAYKSWKQTTTDYDNTTIQTLKDSIFALEKENARLKEESKSKDQKISEMQLELRENTRLLGELKGMITGDQKLNEVIGMITKFEPVLTAIEEFKRSDEEMLSKISLIATSMDKLSKRLGGAA